MIAKRILAPQGGSGYQRLSGYVLNVRIEHRERTDPASWTRLGSRPLRVQGTAEFRSQVAHLAGIEGLGVTFSDAGLEWQRRMLRPKEGVPWVAGAEERIRAVPRSMTSRMEVTSVERRSGELERPVTMEPGVRSRPSDGFYRRVWWNPTLLAP